MSDAKPLAWIGVFDGEPDPEFVWWDEAKARRWINTRPGVTLAPLYCSPTLTDEEREAIDRAAHAAAQLYPGPDGVAVAATLRGVLDRIGHQE